MGLCVVEGMEGARGGGGKGFCQEPITQDYGLLVLLRSLDKSSFQRDLSNVIQLDPLQLFCFKNNSTTSSNAFNSYLIWSV